MAGRRSAEQNCFTQNILTPRGETPTSTSARTNPEIDRVCQGAACLHARIVHINSAGSVVKVRLLVEEFGLAINVDLTPNRYGELVLKVGENVHVFPQRIRIFVPDYAI